MLIVGRGRGFGIWMGTNVEMMMRKGEVSDSGFHFFVLLRLLNSGHELGQMLRLKKLRMLIQHLHFDGMEENWNKVE